jgi:hypothetical protein
MSLKIKYDVATEAGTSSSHKRHDPPALSLDERGMILDCSKSFEIIFGHSRCDLVWQHVSKLFPQLHGVEFIQAGEFNPLLNYLCRCGHLFQLRNRQGDTCSNGLSFVRIENEGRKLLRLIVHSADGGLDGLPQWAHS